MTQRKPILMWGGFVDDRLDMRLTDTGFGGWGETIVNAPAIFRSRKDARAEYQDVRRVKIWWDKP